MKCRNQLPINKVLTLICLCLFVFTSKWYIISNCTLSKLDKMFLTFFKTYHELDFWSLCIDTLVTSIHTLPVLLCLRKVYPPYVRNAGDLLLTKTRDTVNIQLTNGILWNGKFYYRDVIQLTITLAKGEGTGQCLSHWGKRFTIS